MSGVFSREKTHMRINIREFAYLAMRSGTKGLKYRRLRGELEVDIAQGLEMMRGEIRWRG